MKNRYKSLLPIIIFAFSLLSAAAQNTNDANDLIKQGVALHNQGKYAEAVDKFGEVLKADPENPYANYEIAFSLYAAKRPKEAIPHLSKATASSNPQLNAAAYCLLASIYDEDKQTQKAVDTYNLGIKIAPDYPQIYYNLGVAYSKNQQYAEAELAAIEAIKHNPKNASSQRLYALAAFHQNKRANALLGLCSFILLEPTGARAAEAYGNIQHIIQGGVLTDAKGNSTITVSPDDLKETGTLNNGISLVVISSQSKKLTGADLLEYQLKSIFTLAGELSAKKADKSFFDTFFVDYFYKLAQTDNMPTFAHTLTLTDTKEDNAGWAKAHTQQISAMAEWLKNTERKW